MNIEHIHGHWHFPTDIRLKENAVAQVGEICKTLVIKKPLMITDPFLAKLPMVADVVKYCAEQALDCQVFSQVKSNPNEDNVTKALSCYQQGKHDGIIALGGGSAMDVAKATALMVGQKHALWDFEDNNDNWRKADATLMAPVIAIPTTAGTGAEVGRCAVISDSKLQRKRIIFHPNMMPKVVILDPKLTQDLPKNLTAATGMDALAHAIEAFCAPSYHPMAEGIAIEAIRLVKNSLPQVIADGNNLAARAQMLVASTMAATAFQRGLGAMHALAHPLGALYDKHHGLLNAILMPYVLQHNQSAIEARVIRLSRYLKLPDKSFNGFIQWLLALRAQINIPHTLAEIGIDDSKQALVAQMAVDDPCAATNPTLLTQQDYRNLFVKAIKG